MKFLFVFSWISTWKFEMTAYEKQTLILAKKMSSYYFFFKLYVFLTSLPSCLLEALHYFLHESPESEFSGSLKNLKLEK